MQIRSETVGSRAVARLNGELDHHSAAQTRAALDALLLNPKVDELELDLGGVSFMDSSGLGVILGRYRTLSRRGGKLALRGANRHVDRILRMAGVYALCERRDAQGGIEL
ncbi:MAG TPA: anti-sigma factor antagonist [Clostridia bacterium]|nr:anti-sigma factor antagonist [Clostridia bacterium]